MDVTEISILHHVGIVLLLLWLLSFFDRCHPIVYFLSLVYIYLVHERYVMRLRRKVQFEERKQSNQRRVLSDSESVRWMNHVVEKIWPICMENIASQKILLPIIPWFLGKYKPWTAKKVVVQQLYLGRNPPIITDIRVLRQTTGDDHLVLELGMNFLTADDMSTILAVKLRKRLGFGMWAKLHLTGMHVEGKVLVGVKFLREWPFLGRVQVCFAEPPYFQMTVKPIFTHGLDVTVLPGIAGWLDKLLSIAFEQTLVEPNMLVVDMEKFISPQPGESWFSVDEKEPVAYAKVEVIEASDMKPSDLNGLADPYVKGQLGPHRFRTKIQKKTLSPKWHEEFKIPISTWDSPNELVIEACDKDHFRDDTLGSCVVSIGDLRDGQRHDMWLPLQNIKMGRLHLAITVNDGNEKTIFENNVKVVAISGDDDQILEKQDSAKETAHTSSFKSTSSEKESLIPDNFEPINIEGQNETGIWVHCPGSEVAQTWEARKAKSRRGDANISPLPIESTTGIICNETSSGDDNGVSNKIRMKSLRRGFRNISSVFHRSPKNEDYLSSSTDPSFQSPRANLKAVNETEIGVKFVMDASLLNGESESPSSKTHAKDAAKGIMKGAQSLRQALSRKGTTKHRGDPSTTITEQETSMEYDSSEDDDDESSLTSPLVEKIQVALTPLSERDNKIYDIIAEEIKSGDKEKANANNLSPKLADAKPQGDKG